MAKMRTDNLIRKEAVPANRLVPEEALPADLLVSEEAVPDEAILADYHTHSTYSDGHASAEEMIKRALSLGMKRFGISDHVYAPYDTDGCMKKGAAAAYRQEIERLKAVYEGQLEILCGIEQDLYAEEPTDGYDYVIGSVHYVKLGGAYHTVDYRPEDIRGAMDYFHGDIYSVCEAYYDAVAQVVDRTDCTLIGHFDLVSKLNDRYRFFDASHTRYVTAWQQAADALLKTGRPFEINTGAIARGYKQEPYPQKEILEYLAERDAVFVLGSDSHSLEGIGFAFDRWSRSARALGCRIEQILP